jgi:outer membrane protein assembly factor BamB
MSKAWIIVSIVLITLYVALVGCGGATAPLSVGGPAQAAPEISGPAHTQLPLPSTLRGVSYSQQDLYHWGKEYGDALPHSLVSRDSLQAVFAPQWMMPGAQFTDLAYATYQFQLSGFDLNPSVRFTWIKTGSSTDGWVALANFQRDRWEWFHLPESGVLAFDPATNVSGAGVMYVVTLFTGEAEWRLHEIWVGIDDGPGDWSMFGHDPKHSRRSPFTGPATNALRWSYTTGDAVSSSPALGEDGTVYVGSEDHNFYALNPDGSLRWNYTTGGVIESSPVIGVDGTVYVGSNDRKLYALYPNGNLRWAYTTEGAIGQCSPMIGADGAIYVGARDYVFYAIEADGSLKWNYTADEGFYCAAAISADGSLYAGTLDGVLYAFGPDGNKLWSNPPDRHYDYSSPAIGTDGTVYVGNMYYDLEAFNPDGSSQWTYTTGSFVYSSPAIGIDGTIYIGSDDSKLYAINPDGSLKWSYTSGSAIANSSPAIDASGTVYVGSSDGKLYAINAGGSLKWSYATGATIESSPAIGTDGTVFVGSNDGKLYAIGPGGG